MRTFSSGRYWRRGFFSMVGFLAATTFSFFLQPCPVIPSEAKHYLLAANLSDGNIAVFRIDGETGRLTPADVSVPISQPAGMAFIKAE